MNIDPKEFRNVLGTFPTGVCIVCTTSKTQGPIAITINSFTSLSLEPALILWSISANSECLNTIQESQTFSISILSEKQQDLSDLYARKNDHILRPEHCHNGISGTPIITNAVSNLECKTWEIHSGGDHFIIIGQVSSIVTDTTKSPLLFHKGQYRAFN